MILIKGAHVFSPEDMGVKDIMIIHDRIVMIGDELPLISDEMVVIDGKDKILMPGLIDGHVHITGGGGEGSFKTRVPEITLSKLIGGGITTTMGLLGTDSTTRSVENLVAKAKALKEEGVTCLAVTGSYGYPSVTITGSVKKDIVFIDEVIGVKIAISDHRAPSVSDEELARLASDVRVAGMLSGKAGIVVTHMGSSDHGLLPINNVIERWDVPIRTFRPTHVNRKEELLLESFEFAKKGGVIDLTCGIYEEMSPARVVGLAKEKGVPSENITISSDGYGSWSRYDEKGNLVKIGVSSVSSLFTELKKMVMDNKMSPNEALPYFTTNVSRALGIYPAKGLVSEGSDADLVLVDKDFNLEWVIARGQIMMKNSEIIVKGTYE